MISLSIYHSILIIMKLYKNMDVSFGEKQRLAAVLLCVFSLSVIQVAYADANDPLHVVAGVSRQHDDNLFRLSTAARGDNINTAYVGIRLDKAYSLQRFKVDYTVTAHRYQNNNNLNFNAQDYKAAWLWNLTPYLKGVISAERNQQLNDFQDFRGFVKNVRVTQNQHFEADYSPHGVWHLLGGVTRSELKNSQTFREEDNFSMNSLDAGVKYDFRSGSSIKLMEHSRRGRYDNRVLNASLFDTGFDEHEVEAKLDWLISGKSRLNLRTAYVNRQHDNFSQRDFSGMVGRVDYYWNPAAKLNLIFSASSDLGSYQTLDSSYTRNNALSITPVYAITDKINLRANASISERTFLGQGPNPSIGRVDNSNSVGVGIDWTPYRYVILGANLQHSRRNSNVSGLDYSDNIVGVSADLNF